MTSTTRFALIGSIFSKFLHYPVNYSNMDSNNSCNVNLCLPCPIKPTIGTQVSSVITITQWPWSSLHLITMIQPHSLSTYWTSLIHQKNLTYHPPPIILPHQKKISHTIILPSSCLSKQSHIPSSCLTTAFTEEKPSLTHWGKNPTHSLIKKLHNLNHWGKNLTHNLTQSPTHSFTKQKEMFFHACMVSNFKQVESLRRDKSTQLNLKILDFFEKHLW
jgi:hypothetical protein